MAYIDPRLVISPKGRWKLIEILRNGEVDGDGDDDASIAIGEWDGNRCLAIRWNGRSQDETGVGNPQSRGLPTWFIVPDWMQSTFTESDVIPEEKQVLVKALLD